MATYRTIAAVPYHPNQSSPDNLRRLALIDYGADSVPDYLRRVNVKWAASLSVARPGTVPVAGVLYYPGDTVPDHLRKLAAMVADEDMLISDPFAGAAIDTALWDVTDTGSHLSIASGKLSCNGGLVIPVWNDPDISGDLTFSLVAGRTFECEITPSQTNQDQAVGFGSLGDTVGSGRRASVVFASTGLVIPVLNGSNHLAGFAYTVKAYRVRVVLRNPGVAWYLSGDGGLTWDCIGLTPTDPTGTLQANLKSKDGVCTWDNVRVFLGVPPVARLSAAPAVTSPILGADAIINGAFDADTDWTKDAGWTIAAGVASVSVVSGGFYIRQATLTAGAFYLATADLTLSAGAGLGILRGTAATEGPLYGAGAVTRYLHANGTAAGVSSRGAVPLVGTADNVSYSALTLASLLSLVGDSGKKNGVYDCPVTVAATNGSEFAGMAICVDSETAPTYGLLAWIDRTNVVLKKLVAGTWTSLIDTATGVTYAAARKIRIVVSDASVAVYYESAANVFTQIGTTQTVTLTSFGTKVCGFDVSGANTLGAAQAW